MIKLNTTYEPLKVSYATALDPKSASRLIVPIQDSEADLSSVTHRVWELASALGADIKFIGLCKDTAQELSLRRTLTTIAALVNDDNVYAESEIIRGVDVVSAVKSRVQTGDMVVCWKAQQPSFLQANFDVPVYVISGPAPAETPRSNWFKQLIAWIGFLAIIFGFLVLQTRIADFAESWTAVLQVLSVALEIVSILFWNALFS